MQVIRRSGISPVSKWLGLACVVAMLAFSACGGGGSSTPPPPPVASPSANAGGPYAAEAGQTITFDGSKSTDPANLALTYAWNFGDNSTGTGVAPTHAYAKSGTYTVTLRVTNSGAATSPAATATATISAGPVANAGGSYQADVNQPVALDASLSTAPSGTLTYAWDFGDGMSASGASPTVTHTYAAAKSYTATLTVTDAAQAVSTATAPVTIFALPTANPGGPYTGTINVAVTLDASKSVTPAGNPIYSWNFDDGTSASGNGAQVNHTYATAKTYHPSLTVTDKFGGVSSAVTATVTISNNPTANPGGPYAGDVTTPITFDGSKSTDPAGSALTYAWNFGDSTTGTGVSPTHAYAKTGTYTVSLTVTNASNASSSAVTTTATIVALPVAKAGGPYNADATQPVLFDASGSTSSAGALTYAWDYGDGVTASGASPTSSHTYTTAKTYTAKLTVTDANGGSATASVTVTISALPVANAGGPYTTNINVPVTLDASKSTAPAGNPIYNWNFDDGTSASGNGNTVNHTYTAAKTYHPTLTVSDKNGGVSAAAMATVTVLNNPTANPGGPYTADVSQSIIFDGSKSTDPGGSALTYAWNFGDGNTVSVNTATTSHAYTKTGAYTVSLTVTNLSGSSSTAVTTTATIAALPVANAGGPYTADVNQAVLFDASASTSSAGSLIYAWDYGDGTNASGTSSTASHTYTTAKTYTAKLTVTDANGGTATVSVSVPILALPTANAGGPYTSDATVPVQFDASKSVVPAGNGIYNWTFGDGVTASGNGNTVNHAYAKAGTYTASLTITDGNGGISPASTATVTVYALPVANPGGPYTNDATNVITLDGSKSTSSAPGSLTYSWDFGDGTTGAGVSPGHIWITGGTYTVKLTVTDSQGGSSTAATTTATIYNLPVSNPAGPYNANAGDNINFDGSGSKSNVPDGVLTYAWHFGDGSGAATTEFVTHSFSKTGTYTVSLTVTDSNGGTATSSTTATITAPVATSNCNFNLTGSNSALGTTQECTLTYTDSQGQQNRLFRLHIPLNYQELNGNGVVYYLHGSGGDDTEGLTTGWVEKSDAVGFLTVFPQGQNSGGPAGTNNWADYFSPSFVGKIPDDSTFLATLIGHIEDNLFPGGKKVYFTGFSSGAYMAHRMAIDHADLVAAIAAFEGDLWESGPGATNVVVPPVLNNIPVAVTIFNGDADIVVPYCGENDGRGTSASIDDTFNYWSANNVCTLVDPTTMCINGVPQPLSVQGKTGTNCANGADVIAYRLDNGVHRFYDSTVALNVFPGTADAPYNPNFDSVTGTNSVDVAWNFFLNHPKP